MPNSKPRKPATKATRKPAVRKRRTRKPASPLPGKAPRARTNKGLTPPIKLMTDVHDVNELTAMLQFRATEALPDMEMTQGGNPSKNQPMTSTNIHHVLTVCGIDVRTNMMTKDLEYRIAGQWVRRELGEQIALDCLARSKLTNATAARQALANVGGATRYHPAEDWVLQAPWDKRDHFSQFVDAMPFSNPTAARYYLWRFFVQVIECVCGWRKTPPPPKDLVLVLAGGQGLYKTTWVHNLMPPEFTQVAKSLELNSYARGDNLHQLTVKAITEIGELDDTFGRSAQGAMKNFFSSSVDEYRRPYAPNAIGWPRMTAFVSTVNFLEFLRDVTGARRYLVLHVLRHLPNPNDVVDMQQLFAQVYLAWLEYGETHNLLPKEEAIRREQEETYTESTEAEDRLSSYFGKLIAEVPKHDWLPLTWTELCEVVQLRPDRRHTSEVSEWLRKQGIERLPSKADPRKRMCWYVPLRQNDFVRYAADGVQPKTMLKLVKGGKA